MHTFDIGQAFSGGLEAFKKKVGPLLLITIVGGALLFLVNIFVAGTMFAGLGVADVNSDGSIEIESRLNDGIENYIDVLENADDFVGNEDEAARQIAEGFGFDFDELQDITADGEVSDLEALSAFGGSSLNPFSGVNTGALVIGGLLGLIISVLMGIAMATAALDGVFDRKFEVANITKNFSKLPQLIVFAIVAGIISLIAIIPVLGWIAYAIIYFMIIQAPFIILEEGKGPIESIKRSNELMKGNKLRMFGLVIILGITSAILGTITLGLGYLVIMPASVCIMAHTYKQLTQGPVAAAASKVKEAVS